MFPSGGDQTPLVGANVAVSLTKFFLWNVNAGWMRSVGSLTSRAARCVCTGTAQVVRDAMFSRMRSPEVFTVGISWVEFTQKKWKPFFGWRCFVS